MVRRTGSAPVASSSRSYKAVATASDDDFASTNVDLYGRLPHARIDAVVSIEAIISQRYVIEGNGAREVVLGQVGPIIWRASSLLSMTMLSW